MPRLRAAGDDTRKFITAFNSYDFCPESEEWARFFNTGLRHGVTTETEMIKGGYLDLAEDWDKTEMDIIKEAIKLYKEKLNGET